LYILVGLPIGPYAHIQTPLTRPLIGRVIYYGDERDDHGPRKNGEFYDWSFKDFTKRLMFGKWEALEVLFGDLSKLTNLSPLMIPLIKQRYLFLNLKTLTKVLKRSRAVLKSKYETELNLPNRAVIYSRILYDFVNRAMMKEILDPSKRAETTYDPVLTQNQSRVLLEVREADGQGGRDRDAYLRSWKNDVKVGSRTRTRAAEELCKSLSKMEIARGCHELPGRLLVSPPPELKRKRDRLLADIEKTLKSCQEAGKFPKISNHDWDSISNNLFIAKTRRS
jgi:hypothetical protein